MVRPGNECQFIDTSGKKIGEFICEDGRVFHSGRARVKKDGKYGYVNLKGNLVIDVIYEQATDFYPGGPCNSLKQRAL
ncbi:MAG: WG repeat-containing protein [Bacilli bacterium]|nr:WG repeat-containing protein [Bacilli bacterium]MDD4076625.1 WG repeat-containing protein [Bacilli bacterium]MDD4388166.1 WG repeat-containing protein [Bacilli bacterium]